MDIEYDRNHDPRCPDCGDLLVFDTNDCLVHQSDDAPCFLRSQREWTVDKPVQFEPMTQEEWDIFFARNEQALEKSRAARPWVMSNWFLRVMQEVAECIQYRVALAEHFHDDDCVRYLTSMFEDDGITVVVTFKFGYDGDIFPIARMAVGADYV